MNSYPQSISLSLSILTFFFEVEDLDSQGGTSVVRISAELTGEPTSRTTWLSFERTGSQLFELKFAGMVYASGVIKYLINDPSGTGIYGELAVGEPGNQWLFDDLLLALPIEETPLIPLEPSHPVIEPHNPGIPDRISIENAAFSDLFHFVGLQRSSQIPPQQNRHFFSLQTGSDFYKNLLKAVKQDKGPRSIASQFLEKSCQLEIIREVLSTDLYALIEQFEYLKKEAAKGKDQPPNSSGFSWAGISGLQSLETALMEPFVETLKDSLNAIMVLELAPKKTDTGKLPPISGTTDFEKLLLVLRLITFYLRMAAQQPQKDVLASLSAITVLPTEIYSGFFSATTPTQKSPEQGSVQPLGIGELMVLRQVPRSYALGEVAFVENVMPGEKKIRTSKVSSLETEQWEQGDQKEQVDQTRLGTQVAYDILQEIGQVMGQHQQQFQYAPAPASGSVEVPAAPEASDPCSSAKGLVKCFTPTSETLSGGWTLDFSPQRDLQSQAFQFVRDLTSNASARLSRKSQQRHQRILQQERSRVDKHVFDNSQGKVPLIGVYRWINKVSLARLVSLGQRLLLQFEIPNPASGLPDASQLQLEPGLPDLTLLEHANFEVLTPELYFRYAANLGVQDLLPPPAKTIAVTATLSSETRQTQTVLEVPDGYLPSSLSLGYLFNGSHFSALCGAKALTPKNTTIEANVPPKIKPIPLPEVPPMFPTGSTIKPGQLSATDLGSTANSLPVSVLTDASFFTSNLVLDCKLTAERLSTWKVQAWTQLLAIIEERNSSQHNAPQKRSDRVTQQKQLELVRNTLRQEAIQILIGSLTLDDGDPAPEELADFVSDAILWRQMSIQYQAKTDPSDSVNWRELDFDPRKPGQFDEFLEAKVARVVVGLRDKFELIGLYTIWTGGKLWDGLPGDAPILQNFLFYADQLVFENKENRRRIRKEFPISTPTDMIYLQSSKELPGFEMGHNFSSPNNL